MDNQLQTNIELSAQSKVIDRFNNQQSLKTETPSVTKLEVVSDNSTQKSVYYQSVTEQKQVMAQHWYRQCSTQAYVSFYVAIVTSVAAAFLSIAVAVSVFTGNISEAVAEAVLGICSSAASVQLLKIYDKENKRLDEVAKTILESQK